MFEASRNFQAGFWTVTKIFHSKPKNAAILQGFFFQEILVNTFTRSSLKVQGIGTQTLEKYSNTVFSPSHPMDIQTILTSVHLQQHLIQHQVCL